MGGKVRTNGCVMFCVGAAVLTLADLDEIGVSISAARPESIDRVYNARGEQGGAQKQTLTHSLNSGRRSPLDALTGAANSTIIATIEKSINCILPPPIFLLLLLCPIRCPSLSVCRSSIPLLSFLPSIVDIARTRRADRIGCVVIKPKVNRSVG